MDNPLVSVVIVTYNHEKYIAEAIEGALMQKINCPYEILIGEDDSSDGTREICKGYAKEYPEKIRLFLNDRQNVIYINGRSTGRWNFINLLKKSKGKYVALCEGDDYWTDPLKLQKQTDFLEANTEFTICSHNVLLKYEDQGKLVRQAEVNRKEIITIEDVIGEGSQGATCSLVFRNKVFGEFPDWFYKSRNGDVPLQILCTSKGKMKCFKEIMGVYRKHNAGYSVIEPDSQAQIDRFETHVCTQEAINKYFNYRYDKLIRKHLVTYLYPKLVRAYLHNGVRIIAGANKYTRMIIKEDANVYRISFFERIKYTILIIVTDPIISLYKIIKRFRKFI